MNNNEIRKRTMLNGMNLWDSDDEEEFIEALQFARADSKQKGYEEGEVFGRAEGTLKEHTRIRKLVEQFGEVSTDEFDEFDKSGMLKPLHESILVKDLKKYRKLLSQLDNKVDDKS